jgi:hypothetical protein
MTSRTETLQTGKPRTEKPLTLAAMLSFWGADPDELCYLLGQLIPSLSGLVDRLIAYDGAYEGFPGGTPSSGERVHTRLRELAARAGIAETTIHIPAGLWPGHVAKRQAMVTEAMIGSDWVCPIDTDYVITGSAAEAREQLADLGSTVDLATVPVYTPPPPRKTIEEAATSEWHISTAGTTIDQPFFIRSLPGFRYEFRHWCYSALKGGKRISLWGAQAWYPTTLQVSCPALTIEHRKFFRLEKNIAERRAFYERRQQIIEETGVEP